ncbi:MAG: PQQ-dependent sugar dehydrogenase [Burkholderiales bacterium]|nr:PQQ-dependent sugar dehydrogenase [Burkholderiales bacterium]
MACTAHRARWFVGRTAVVLLLGSCGGGGGDTPGEAPAPVASQPVATIASPAPGATFRAGDTVSYAGNAVDTRDGALTASALTWWVDLHHDTHTHPFRPPTAGAGGTVTIPTRGETSHNVFYRFHLRATNSAGVSVEVTRDMQPQKATVTLATVPAGLRLTLEGQPVTAPSTFTGVVGFERDIAAADQVVLGRRWRFDGWRHGGAASQTLATPAGDTTYTADFTDLGPATNQPPSVTLLAPPAATVGDVVTLNADATDAEGSVSRVDFIADGAVIGSDTTAPFTLAWTPVRAGTVALRARAFDNGGLDADSAVVEVTVGVQSGGDVTAPTATLTAPTDLADGLDGMVVLAAEASDDVGVAAVEFQVDGVGVGEVGGAGGEDASAPYEVTIDSTQWARGQHVVRARARDAAGNRSAWSTALVRFGGGRVVPAGFTKDEPWVGGLAAAAAFAQAPDGRLFVAEQGGALRVVKAGTLLPTPFHTLAVEAFGERGLIGVALHPGFAGNGFVYVYYTHLNGEARNNRVARLTADIAAGGDISTGVETVLLDLPDLIPFADTHNGGAMRFGIDGKLYVAVGDNADTSKPQDLSHPFGKMLRLNDDGSFPPDNPFAATQPGWGRAVWAYGLRNPFTFAIQPGSGRMHINDVGNVRWEEINLGAAGANYGWPGSEGPDNLGAGITAPLFAYAHEPAAPPGSGPGGFFVGSAIVGGAFYPDDGPFPAGLRGKYFFADYVERFIGVVDVANGNAAYAFGSVDGLPVDLLVGSDGALYVLTRDSVARISAAP